MVIVGSGAGGGMAAYVLAKAGVKVCLLEAGPMFDPAKNSTQLKIPGSLQEGAPVPNSDHSVILTDVTGAGKLMVNPTPKPRVRNGNGGGPGCSVAVPTTGAGSLRFGPKDFKRKSIDGLGDDWPISYDDIKPYYDKVDQLIGVFGTNEGLENDPDGFFLPPPKPRLHELMIKNGATKAGVKVIPSRLSILTKKINDERGACFFCAQCNRSCKVYGDFLQRTDQAGHENR